MENFKVTNIKIDPPTVADLLDLARVADFTSGIVRCPGGRLISSGYVCVHCGQDPTTIYEEKGHHFRKCGESRKKYIEEIIKDPNTLINQSLPMEDTE